MSMYLPNDETGPTGAEGAEFIDAPMPAPDSEPDEDAALTPETDEDHGGEAVPPGMRTDADES